MRHFSGDSWLGIALLILLLVITFIAAAGNTEEATNPALATFSAQPDGGKALRLWLTDLGFAVNDSALRLYEPPQKVTLIFILEPLLPITPQEWDTLDAWVEDGGTLILAGDRSVMFSVARHYDFRMHYGHDLLADLRTQTPLWNLPPFTDAAAARPRAYFQTGRDDFITHLAVKAGPVLVSFEQGAGRVILSATSFPFSNAGLKERGNPSLVLNVVTMAAQAGEIWFDEWHHGLQAGAAEVIGPGNWLRYTSAGRSLLYVALLVFVAIALQGRRFGRPVPLRQDSARRAPLEYITAIANLSRRAGHRRAVLARYQLQLKRGLGQRYRLNPTLPNDDYVAQLAALNPTLDADALRTLLARLGRSKVSESELVSIAAEVTGWLQEA